MWSLLKLRDSYKPQTSNLRSSDKEFHSHMQIPVTERILLLNPSPSLQEKARKKSLFDFPRTHRTSCTPQ
jgi:hypothetical protein